MCECVLSLRQERKAVRDPDLDSASSSVLLQLCLALQGSMQPAVHSHQRVYLCMRVSGCIHVCVLAIAISWGVIAAAA